MERVVLVANRVMKSFKQTGSQLPRDVTSNDWNKQKIVYFFFFKHSNSLNVVNYLA